MKMTIDGEELWGMAVVLAFSLVPIIAATILTYRSFRRRWWLAGPGVAFVTVSPLLAWVLHLVGAFGETATLGLAASIGMFFGSWIAAGLFLTALAIAGPKLPVIDVGEIF